MASRNRDELRAFPVLAFVKAHGVLPGHGEFVQTTPTQAATISLMIFVNHSHVIFAI